jgi:integrase/recombinase XerD
LPDIVPYSQLPALDDSDQFVIDMWLHSKSALTKANYIREANTLLSFVGKPLRHITLQDLQAYHSSLMHLKASTQATRLATAKSLLTFAEKVGAAPTNVGIMLPSPRVNSRLDTRIIEEDDVLAMIDAETDPRNNLLLHLLYNSGCRVSEICGLRIRDCKRRRDEGQITVIGKGDKQRTILLTPDVWSKLVPFLTGAPDAYVFSSRKGAITRQQIGIIVKRAAKRAGLSATISSHFLRHAAASHALDNGCPISVVQTTLGHASLDTTTKYVHVRPGDGLSRYLRPKK